MITAIIVSPEQKRGGVIGASMYQGQWGFFSGTTEDGVPKILPVTTSGHASKHGSLLFPVMFVPQFDEDAQTYQNATPMPSGTRVVCLIGDGISIEDDYVNSRKTVDWTNTLPGALVCLSISGYPYVTSGAQITDIGQTPVALFEYMHGTSVVFRTITAASGVTG